jgi:hypothetical protein
MKKVKEKVILWYDARVAKKRLISEHEKSESLSWAFKKSYTKLKGLVSFTGKKILYDAVDLIKDSSNALFLLNPTSFCYLAVLCANWIVFFVMYENHK